jgi:hypothetical protein
MLARENGRENGKDSTADLLKEWLDNRDRIEGARHRIWE